MIWVLCKTTECPRKSHFSEKEMLPLRWSFARWWKPMTHSWGKKGQLILLIWSIWQQKMLLLDKKSIHIGMSSLMNIKTSPMLGTDWSRQFWIRQGQIFFAWEMTGSLSTGLREVIFRSLQILNAISDAAWSCAWSGHTAIPSSS